MLSAMVTLVVCAPCPFRPPPPPHLAFVCFSIRSHPPHLKVIMPARGGVLGIMSGLPGPRNFCTRPLAPHPLVRRIASSKGEHVRTPGSTNRHAHSASMASHPQKLPSNPWESCIGHVDAKPANRQFRPSYYRNDMPPHHGRRPPPTDTGALPPPKWTRPDPQPLRVPLHQQ